MGLRIFIKIKGSMYDFWEVRALEPDEEYDETLERMVSTIVMNRGAISLNYQDKVFRFDTYEERDEELKIIQNQLTDHELVLLVGKPESELGQ